MSIVIPEFLDSKITLNNNLIENNITKIKILKLSIKQYSRRIYATILANNTFQIVTGYNNISNLILNSTIISGELDCNCKIVLDNGSAKLLDVNSDMFNTYKLQSNKVKYHCQKNIGDVLTDNSINYLIFLGAVEYQKDNIKLDKNNISKNKSFLFMKIKKKDLNKSFNDLYKSKRLELAKFYDDFFTDDNCKTIKIPEDYKKNNCRLL